MTQPNADAIRARAQRAREIVHHDGYLPGDLETEVEASLADIPKLLAALSEATRPAGDVPEVVADLKNADEERVLFKSTLLGIACSGLQLGDHDPGTCPVVEASAKVLATQPVIPLGAVRVPPWQTASDLMVRMAAERDGERHARERAEADAAAMRKALSFYARLEIYDRVGLVDAQTILLDGGQLARAALASDAGAALLAAHKAEIERLKEELMRTEVREAEAVSENARLAEQLLQDGPLAASAREYQAASDASRRHILRDEKSIALVRKARDRHEAILDLCRAQAKGGE